MRQLGLNIVDRMVLDLIRLELPKSKKGEQEASRSEHAYWQRLRYKAEAARIELPPDIDMTRRNMDWLQARTRQAEEEARDAQRSSRQSRSWSRDASRDRSWDGSRARDRRSTVRTFTVIKITVRTFRNIN